MGTKKINISFAYILILSFLINIFVFDVYANPNPPSVASAAAILIDADTGEVLYEKNPHSKYPPASITKLLTALLVLERMDLNAEVVFSDRAVNNLESGAVKIGMKVGDKISVDAGLHALLLKSANEVANALAESTSGSISDFVKLMNDRSRLLGCKNTVFANPSGLNAESQLTTAYDMAQIAKVCFNNSKMLEIMSAKNYNFSSLTGGVSAVLNQNHKMMQQGNSNYYEGVLGGKTGYTSKAGNTLVTLAKKNGRRLIAVVLKSSQTHYVDTRAMLDYGFALANTATATSLNTEQAKNLKLQSRVTQVAGGTVVLGVSPSEFSSSSAGSADSNKDFKSMSISTDSTYSNSNNTIVTGISPSEFVLTNKKEEEDLSYNGPAFEVVDNLKDSIVPGWYKEGELWYYIKDNRLRARSELLNINGSEYWFDSTTFMATGWRQDEQGRWFFFNKDGALIKSAWELYKGKWYYLGSNAVMLTSSITPDGYVVGADGAWIEQ